MHGRFTMWCVITLSVGSILLNRPAVAADDRPNILWITSEDNGPHLGCYGDDYAVTPSLDQFASTGTRYLTCWSNAPVYAPARTCVISGLYPASTGSQHMRSLTRSEERRVGKVCRSRWAPDQ